MTQPPSVGSAALTEALASCEVARGQTLRDALGLGGPVSLWDVAASYLALYRFPLLSQTSRTALRLRPYRGLAARALERLSRPARTTAACAAWAADRRTIVFLGFTPGFYRDVLRPVAERLSREGTGRVVVLADDAGAIAPSLSAGVECESPTDHWDAGAAAAERQMLRRLSAVRAQVFAREARGRLEKAAATAGAGPGLLYEFRWLFWRELVRLVPRLAAARHVLDRHRPALIVSADDADQRCRIYSLQARATGIPSLLVQQGLSRRDIPEWGFLSHDAMAAMGQSSFRDALAQGVSADQVVVTGHPGLDQFASSDPAGRAVRDELGIGAGEVFVLLASQPPVPGAFTQNGHRVEMLRAVLRAASSVGGVRLVVKPHPGERRRELLALAADHPRVIVADGRRDIVPLIRGCDVFATFFSTTALQALYAGKPVITVDFHDEPGARRFVDSGATLVARSAADLEQLLRSLTSPARRAAIDAMAPRRRAFLHDEVGPTDGNAASRVAGLACQLLGRSQVVHASSVR